MSLAASSPLFPVRRPLFSKGFPVRTLPRTIRLAVALALVVIMGAGGLGGCASDDAADAPVPCGSERLGCLPSDRCVAFEGVEECVTPCGGRLDCQNWQCCTDRTTRVGASYCVSAHDERGRGLLCQP